ncbi:MAG: hypothetical protein HKP24_05445 [Croceitalea sp.]|nr:hypothetical protein [Croceitalea sp.]
MINLFKGIRRRLWSDKNFTKYVLYAIGEIVLVVIGILIALQINNWKEQQKLNQLQTVYLERMVNDLSQDLLNFDNVIKDIEANQQAITKFIEVLDSGVATEAILPDILGFYERGWIISDFAPTENTYIDLSQTGNMKVIENTQLVNEIIEYYGYMDIVEGSADVNTMWITPIDQAVAKETASFEIDPNTAHLFHEKDKTKAIKNLLLNKELMQRDAAGHYWINTSLKGNLEAMKNLSVALKEAIENELKAIKE